MLLLLALLAAAPAIRTDFDGGSLGRVGKVAERHFRCAVEGEADQDNSNRQASWYYFRIDQASGGQITIDLVDLAREYNYPAPAVAPAPIGLPKSCSTANPLRRWL